MLVLKEWRRLVWWPGIVFVLAFALVEIGQFDRTLARALFYSPESGWLGAGAGNWWARDVIHQSGRWLPRGIAALAAAGWLVSFRVAALGKWRRELLYVFCGMALVIGSVGILKELTNVDCPWDLVDFGGANPYVPLFADRPNALKHAACFPAAHSSSGFALMAIYFALLGRAPRAARGALYAAIAVGLVFAFGQEARGAHFLSHDLTSAALAWLILVSLYSAMLAPRPARASQVQAREGEREHAAGQAAHDIA
jgi:membrane-associated PAP2 superfamily phosphatase